MIRPTTRSARPTLEDVAARAHVSQATVSLLLNGHTNVCSPETAKRIYAAIEELNYNHPGLARNAARKTTLSGSPVGDKREFPRDASAYHSEQLARQSSVREEDDTTPPAESDRVPGEVQGARDTSGREYGLRRRETTPRTIGVCLGIARNPVATARLVPQRRTSTATIYANLADQILRGIRLACDMDNLRVVLYPYSIYMGESVEPFLDGSITGLILASGYVDPRPQPLIEAGLPVLLLNRFRDVPEGCGAVFTIEGDTIELAMSHLWNLGHRRIAYMAGPGGLSRDEASGRRRSRPLSSAEEIMKEMRNTASDTSVRRMERYITWMELRQAFDPALVVMTQAWQDRTYLRSVLGDWLSLPEPPTAVFCGHEGAAINLLAAATAAGLRVPQDLSLVGVDTESGLMGQSYPPLTCVEIPAELMGIEAVRTLVRLIDGTGRRGVIGKSGVEMTDAVQIAVPVTRLVERQSTAPPRELPRSLQRRF